MKVIMDTLGYIIPDSLFAVVHRVWVDEYWYEAEVWGRGKDQGGTLDTRVWVGSCQHKYYEDARAEAETMLKII